MKCNQYFTFQMLGHSVPYSLLFDVVCVGSSVIIILFYKTVIKQVHKHSRDITLLIDFNIMDYSSLFQYFLSMCYVHYSS